MMPYQTIFDVGHLHDHEAPLIFGSKWGVQSGCFCPVSVILRDPGSKEYKIETEFPLFAVFPAFLCILDGTFPITAEIQPQPQKWEWIDCLNQSDPSLLFPFQDIIVTPGY
jgi:hypothetical protein